MTIYDITFEAMILLLKFAQLIGFVPIGVPSGIHFKDMQSAKTITWGYTSAILALGILNLYFWWMEP